MLYVYFVLNLIKLGTESSLLGFLRPLIIKFVNTAMKQEAWPHNGLYRLPRGLQVFIVHLICCLRKKFVKDSFDNLYQEETLYKVELYVKCIREDSWPRNCFGFLVFLYCFVSFCFSALEQLNMVAFKNR